MEWAIRMEKLFPVFADLPTPLLPQGSFFLLLDFLSHAGMAAAVCFSCQFPQRFNLLRDQSLPIP
jgi:hypothetical protein